MALYTHKATFSTTFCASSRLKKRRGLSFAMSSVFPGFRSRHGELRVYISVVRPDPGAALDRSQNLFSCTLRRRSLRQRLICRRSPTCPRNSIPATRLPLRLPRVKAPIPQANVRDISEYRCLFFLFFGARLVPRSPLPVFRRAHHVPAASARNGIPVIGAIF